MQPTTSRQSYLFKPEHSYRILAIEGKKPVTNWAIQSFNRSVKQPQIKMKTSVKPVFAMV